VRLVHRLSFPQRNAVLNRCSRCDEETVLGGHPKPAINRHLKTGN
jgi:hypothetical protein